MWGLYYHIGPIGIMDHGVNLNSQLLGSPWLPHFFRKRWSFQRPPTSAVPTSAAPVGIVEGKHDHLPTPGAWFLPIEMVRLGGLLIFLIIGFTMLYYIHWASKRSKANAFETTRSWLSIQRLIQSHTS